LASLKEAVRSDVDRTVFLVGRGMADLTITLAGEQVVLLPERALYWRSAQTLLVADVHWGKAASLRAAAIALPGGNTSSDLTRLSAALDRTRARRLVVLGDLLHARAGRSAQVLAAAERWRARHPQIELLLIRGNHDRHAGDPEETLGFICVDEPVMLAPFELRHTPVPPGAGYGLAGHLHPGAQLSGPGRQRLRLPCFWFGSGAGVLPAFGGMTGTATIQPAPGDRVFVVAEDEVIDVSG
jgi:DNA ligase-associated metallophosphoesterase